MEKQQQAKAVLGESELEKLRMIRDEIRLQAHLFSAELKQEWKRLEQNWTLIKNDSATVKPVLTKAIMDAGKAAEPLIRELQATYDRIRADLKKIGGHPT
jgi:hypothetical protein